MGSVNTVNPKVDLTVRIFDRFYQYQTDVPAEEFDLVNSFFLSIFGSKPVAENFTVTLFRVSEESGIPVLSLLAELEGQSQLELTATLAYYLNGLRSPSTLVGINATVTPNFWAARNVLP